MILITGATGFLGRFIVRALLAEKRPVRMLVRNAKHPALAEFQGKVEVAEGDILDVASLNNAFKGVTAVIHTAALVAFWKRRHEAMRQANVQGTANVVNFALEYGLQRLVQVSSVAALGVEGNPITENTKFRKETAKSYYGLTKAMAEREVIRGAEEGLPSVICNPSIILGASDDWSTGSPNLFQKVWDGLSFSPRGTNGFVGAEDVARAVVLLLDAPQKEGERFILNSENLSYMDFFQLVAKHLKKNPPSRLASPTLAGVYGWISELQAAISGGEPIVTRETARNSAGVYAYDSTLFQKTFNFKFQPVATLVEAAAQHFLAQHGTRR